MRILRIIGSLIFLIIGAIAFDISIGLGILFILLGLYIAFGNKIAFLKKLNNAEKEFRDKEAIYEEELAKARSKAEGDVQRELDDIKKQITSSEEKLKNLEEEIANKENIKQKIIEEALKDAEAQIKQAFKDRSNVLTEVKELKEESKSLQKKVASETKKMAKAREFIKAFNYSLKYSKTITFDNYELPKIELEQSELLRPSRTLTLQSSNFKELKKLFNENEKLIDAKLKEYEIRYTTKANQSIYQLMVLALRAELQNILYSLKYRKLDAAIEDIKVMTGKYLQIAAAGNQLIAPTLTKFVGEIEYLFINAIKIEYEYYIKKEQDKAEQAALREQMREEAAERKRLKEEQEKLEKEESKFKNELSKLNENLNTSTNDAEKTALIKRIEELTLQLEDMNKKRDEIINLQNGKAGNVYIISNIGSFGENVFKIGMTRRLDPMERINELGSASVPFSFDVHSTIFSENAVDLENSLHKALDKKRINLVNVRKEFFGVSLDELEELVNEIDPTAEFNRTILAEEYNQSLYIREQMEE